jgi:hypothetical protein
MLDVVIKYLRLSIGIYIKNLSSDFLQRRKKQFQVKPYILFVFDEAQEFVRHLTNAKGIGD